MNQPRKSLPQRMAAPLGSRYEIKWTVPSRWHRQKVRAELHRILSVSSVLRIALVSILLSLGIWFWLERKLGPLDFNWPRAILISVLAGLGMLFVGAALSFIPPTICISAKGIDVVQSPDHPLRILYKDMMELSIQLPDPPILHFRKGKRDYRYAIAESIDLEQLRQQLERFSGRPVQILQTTRS